MSAFEQTTLLVLGAGYSTRFGGDKLSADLNGQPVATHLLASIGSFRFKQKLLVYRGQTWGKRYVDAGFATLEVRGNNGSQGASLRRGLAHAHADNVLVMLADMPFISTAHLCAIESAFLAHQPQPVASGDPPRPPAMFRRAHLDEMPLEGDRGARDLLVHAIPVPADARVLLDIDRPDELESHRWCEARPKS